TYHWDDEGRLEGGELLLPGGYDQVISHLALGTDIRTRHVVERIVAGKQGVTVATNRGVFSADRCLVTVPLGVLQAGGITFEPELPLVKRSALRNLRMGALNKIFLRFPYVFWPEEHVIGQLAQQPGEWPWFVNLYPSTHKPVLLGLHAGSYGLRLEAMSDEELIAAAMNVLRRLFGQRIPQPIECHITRWGADPFTHGSYSHIPPGASADDYEVLAHPVDNRVFFAGEATARQYSGTVHGAYLSGLREAARIATG
ncbi:MAG TPA: FAD-dependent oxidoreductase, partial [Ktedonobacterales bacterium]|nr:FAD-dependent oxidoreductase [Ktedonobacterales bacterium]